MKTCSLTVILSVLALIILVSPRITLAQCAGIDSRDLTTHVSNQIDNRISGLDPTVALPIYATRNSVPWIRKTDSWTEKLTPIDFTGVAGYNDDLANHFGSGLLGGATLITPRHYVTAEHFKLANGTSISFMDNAGNPIVRKVVNSMTVPGTDINIGLLDSDLPNSIAFYQLIDSTVLQSMLQITSGEIIDVPIALFNQSGQTIVRSMSGISSEITHALYTAGPRAAFSRELAGGDSGQPAFLIINGKAILLFTNHTPNSGPNLGNYISQINQAIDTLGDSGGYHVSQYNPSCFNESTPIIPATMTSAPGNFKSCFIGNNKDQVKLFWTVPSDVPDRYGLSVDFGAFMSLPGSAISFVHSSIVPGSSHSYVLVAHRAGFNGSQAQRTDLSNAQLCVSEDVVKKLAVAEQTTAPAAIPAQVPIVTIPPVVQNPPPATDSTAKTQNKSSQANSAQASPTATAVAVVKNTNQSNTASQSQAQNNSGASSGGSNSNSQSSAYSSYGSGSIITYRQVQNAGSGSTANKTTSATNPQVITVTTRTFISQISHNLRLNDQGNDVRSLQVILNNLGYSVALNGPGSIGLETTNFNEATKAALMKYQSDRANVGLKATGVLDNVTLILINNDIANKLSEARAQEQTISNANSDNNQPTIISYIGIFFERVLGGINVAFGNLLRFLHI